MNRNSPPRYERNSMPLRWNAAAILRPQSLPWHLQGEFYAPFPSTGLRYRRASPSRRRRDSAHDRSDRAATACIGQAIMDRARIIVAWLLVSGRMRPVRGVGMRLFDRSSRPSLPRCKGTSSAQFVPRAGLGRPLDATGSVIERRRYPRLADLCPIVFATKESSLISGPRGLAEPPHGQKAIGMRPAVYAGRPDAVSWSRTP